MSPGLVRTDMTESMWGPPEEQPWNDVGRMVAAVVRFARGDLDALHGRFVHAVRDDLDTLVGLADTIDPRGRPHSAPAPLRPRRPARLTVAFSTP